MNKIFWVLGLSFFCVGSLWPLSLQRLSLEEKVGQVLMVAIDSETLRSQQEWILSGRLGGVLLRHDRFTAEEVLETTDRLQRWAFSSRPRIPVWVAVDHEGGAVFTQRSLGATHFPSQMAIAATRNPNDAYLAAFTMAQELRSLGIHIDFAPVLDVNNNPDNPVIGIRSYGEDPALAARLGTQAIWGFEKGGVASVGKHFPGHGDTDVDSHLGLPVIRHPLQRLERVEFLPFRRAIQAGVPAIMTAHIVFPELTGPELPATLSPAVLIGVLRKKLGFRGMVVTDSLDMQAITSRRPLPEAAVLALQQGSDLILIGKGSLEETHRAMVQAVRRKQIPVSRLDEAGRQVLTLKRRLEIFENPYGSQVRMKRGLGSPAHQRVAQDIADRSITVLRNEGRTLPWRMVSEEKLLLVLVAGGRFTLDMELFVEEVRKRHPYTEFRVLKPDLTASELEEAEKQASRVSKVFVGTFQWGKAFPETRQAELVRRLLKSHPDLVAAAWMNPYDVRFYPEVKNYLCLYGITPAGVRALVKVLFGEISPRGKLPVGIPGLFPAGSGLTWPVSGSEPSK